MQVAEGLQMVRAAARGERKVREPPIWLAI
jgi:hypothetical protein